MTTESGEYAMHTFSDEHMSRLYEKFILEYYKRHHPECKPRAAQVKWNFDMDQVSAESSAVLPIMQTDIFLEIGSRTLIIDAKYYSHSLSEHIGKNVHHTNNFYQINSYVLNYYVEHTVKDDGMLLSAQTQNEGVMNYSYPHRDGNVFYVKSLDLNQDFDSIKAQLENIISDIVY
jgi:5-methylcytosine-specific restriction enzyme subunit McrC